MAFETRQQSERAPLLGAGAVQTYATVAQGAPLQQTMPGAPPALPGAAAPYFPEGAPHEETLPGDDRSGVPYTFLGTDSQGKDESSSTQLQAKASCCSCYCTLQGIAAVVSGVSVTIPYIITNTGAISDSVESGTLSACAGKVLLPFFLIPSLIANIPMSLKSLKKMPEKMGALLPAWEGSTPGYKLAAGLTITASLVISAGASLPFYYAIIHSSGAALAFFSIESAALLTLVKASAAAYTAMSAVGLILPSVSGYTLPVLDKFVRSTGCLTKDEDERARREIQALLTPDLIKEQVQNLAALKTAATKTLLAIASLEAPPSKADERTSLLAKPDPSQAFIQFITDFDGTNYGTLCDSIKSIVWGKKSTADNLKNLTQMAVVGLTAAMLYHTTSSEVTALFTETWGLINPGIGAEVLGYFINLAEAAFCLAYGMEGVDTFLASLREPAGEDGKPGPYKSCCKIMAEIIPIFVTAATLGPTALQAGGEKGLMGALVDWKSVLAMINAGFANFTGVKVLQAFLHKCCAGVSAEPTPMAAVENKLKALFTGLPPAGEARNAHFAEKLPELIRLIEQAEAAEVVRAKAKSGMPATTSSGLGVIDSDLDHGDALSVGSSGTAGPSQDRMA